MLNKSNWEGKLQFAEIRTKMVKEVDPGYWF